VLCGRYKRWQAVSSDHLTSVYKVDMAMPGVSGRHWRRRQSIEAAKPGRSRRTSSQPTIDSTMGRQSRALSKPRPLPPSLSEIPGPRLVSTCIASCVPKVHLRHAGQWRARQTGHGTELVCRCPWPALTRRRTLLTKHR
jgi:hypothetical protein